MKVLFLCTGNSCRSQMAEGFARAVERSSIEAFSAGTKPKGVDPLAVRVMAEVGVDISRQASKGVEALANERFDFVVTVCDSAREACPVFPGGATVVHVGFEDPPALARAAKSESEVLTHYRRVRDEIRSFVDTLPESLEKRDTAAHRRGR